ncbi:MAG: hypothetical protein AAFO84_13605 [Cyanobacteria bacterium J06598_1]
MVSSLFSWLSVLISAAAVVGLLSSHSLMGPTDSGLTEREDVDAVYRKAIDSISHPPLRQTFSAGDYQLVIAAVDEWHTEGATAQLYKGTQLQWEQRLPHAYGPRFAQVGVEGQVALFDEFINVASPRAVMVIARSGDVIAQHSFEAVGDAIARSAADLTTQATSGWWISAPPVLNDAGNEVLVKTGGTMLEIDLVTGELRHHLNL